MLRLTIIEAFAFRNIVAEELNTGHTNLVLALRKCEYIDSKIFGTIIMALNTVNEIRGKLSIVKSYNPKKSLLS